MGQNICQTKKNSSTRMAFCPLAAALILLLAAACASEPKPDPLNQKEFDLIMDEASALTDSSGGEKNFSELAERMNVLLAKDPFIAGQSVNKDKLNAFIEKHPIATCSGNVVEPDGELYAWGGYKEPVKFQWACTPVPSKLLEVNIQPSPSLMAKGDTVTRGLFKPEGSVEYPYNLKTASYSAEENTLSAELNYAAAVLWRECKTQFGLSSERIDRLKAPPVQHQIKKVPQHHTEAYHKAGGIPQPVDEVRIGGNDTMQSEIKVAANSQFTLGGKYNGKPFDLLYGHPNGPKPNGIYSSFFTIKVDNKTYRLHDLEVSKIPLSDSVEFIGGIPGQKVHFSLVFEAKHNDKLAAMIVRLKVHNTGKKTRRIGIRLLLDTWAGNHDGSAFIIPTGRSEHVFTKEVMFSTSAATYWQTFDVNEAADEQGAVFLQNSLLGQGLVPPDRIAFVGWERAYKTEWDYKLTNRTILHDSAVLMWWNPVKVRGKKSIEASLRFGAVLHKTETRLITLDAGRGFYSILLQEKNSTQQTQKISHSFSLEGGELHILDDTAEGSIEAGGFYVRAVPVQIVCPATCKLKVEQKIDGTSTTKEFPIGAGGEWKRASIAQVHRKGGKVPVHYFHKEKMVVRARLRSPSGKVIYKTVLERMPYKDGYKYSGFIAVPKKFAGRAKIEIYK